MVNFEELLKKSPKEKQISPVEIFSSLRKQLGKNHLRGSQETVLLDWYENYRSKKDSIIKLPTGEGKTLIGLLILQSLLNQNEGPCIYICPDKNLVSQTIEQAKIFGIKTCQTSEINSSLPHEFLNSESIFVTNCHKLFNGQSAFGVRGSGKEIRNIGGIVLDDAHRCLDIIREQFSIIVQRDLKDPKNVIYDELFGLFQDSLKYQEPGTYEDINSGREDCILGVPYWTWHANIDSIRLILKKYSGEKNLEIFYKWDLIKNKLEYCNCVFSGSRLEIVPRIISIDLLPSFDNAKHRIFLSATLMEDAFLIKDLAIDPYAVKTPLTHTSQIFSGERTIIIPSYINPLILKKNIISWITHLSKKYPDIGKWVIVPSKNISKDWSSNSLIIEKNLIKTNREQLLLEMSERNALAPYILVNRYDGIDLPDNLCRILILDSLPRNHLLIDQYMSIIRSDSQITKRSIAQRIEQGMGRGIRNNEDYCIIIIIGNEISDYFLTKEKSKYLSPETRVQTNIFKQISGEFDTTHDLLTELEKFIDQILKREDDDWVKYYLNEMANVEINEINHDFIESSIKERNAEIFFQLGQREKAITHIEELLSKTNGDVNDLSWYLQLKATYLFPTDNASAMDCQIKAYELNQNTFRPIQGIKYQKLTKKGISQGKRIFDIIISKENPTSLILFVSDILEKLVFSADHNRFEQGIDELGKILGLNTQRPEKQYLGGPDNLWEVTNGKYWIISCKNEVINDRGISIDEANQLSGHISWFNENYSESNFTPIFCHPSNFFMEGASISYPTYVFQKDNLNVLKEQVKSFYIFMGQKSQESLSKEFITEQLKKYNLLPETIISKYLKRI
jgi:tetratricopeptide (TPR) repeat protein